MLPQPIRGLQQAYPRTPSVGQDVSAQGYENLWRPFGQMGGADNMAINAGREHEYDERTRQQRQDEDETWRTNLFTGQNLVGPGGSGASRDAAMINNAQQDVAMGPGGYNRQWVPFFEPMRGRRMNTRGLDLPTEGLQKAAPNPNAARRSSDIAWDQAKRNYSAAGGTFKIGV